MATIPSQTRYGPPRLSRILYFLSGGLVFATLMQSKEIVHEWSDLPVLLLVVVVFSSLGWGGWLISRGSQKRQHKLRDQRAEAILYELKAERECAYCVYLRGFKAEGKILALMTRNDFELRGNPEPFQNMEVLVAQAMEPIAPLIALGHRGEQMGAGRVETAEEEWEHDFHLLAAHAKFLFLLPGETSGVVQEIKWIRDQKIWGRLLLLMPQEDRSIKWSERWGALRATIAKEGLDLPEYRACGLIFKLGQTGRMELFQPVKLGYKDLGQMLVELAGGKGMTPDDNLIQCPSCGYCERRSGPGKITCQFCRRRIG